MEETQIAPRTALELSSAAFFWRGRGFPVAFIVLAELLLVLIAHLPENCLDFWCTAVMGITRIIGTIVGLKVVNQADIMTVNGFAMRIITHCTAIHYIAILSSAMLLSTWHSLRYRINGLVIAIPLLVLFNSIRLLLTGLAGAVSPLAFSFVHDYLWVTVFILVTFGAWIVWDQGVSKSWILGIWRVLEIIICCTIFQLLLVACERQVGALITGIASRMTALMPGIPEVTVTWESGRVIFTQGASSFSGLFMAEMVTFAVYAGLVVSEFMHGGVKAVTRILAGGALLLLVCAAMMALCGPVAVRFGFEAAGLYLWVTQGLMLALPIGMWLMIKGNKAAVSPA